jgi:hypothetical protein
MLDMSHSLPNTLPHAMKSMCALYVAVVHLAVLSLLVHGEELAPSISTEGTEVTIEATDLVRCQRMAFPVHLCRFLHFREQGAHVRQAWFPSIGRAAMTSHHHLISRTYTLQLRSDLRVM